MKQIEAGAKLKLTRKSFGFYFDSQWKTGLSTHYIDLLLANLGREAQSMAAGVPFIKGKHTMTIHTGKSYRLKLYLLGFGACFTWHRHNPRGFKGTEKDP